MNNVGGLQSLSLNAVVSPPVQTAMMKLISECDHSPDVAGQHTLWASAGLCLSTSPYIPQDNPWDLRVTIEMNSVEWNVTDFEGCHMKELNFFPLESAYYTNYSFKDADAKQTKKP